MNGGGATRRIGTLLAVGTHPAAQEPSATRAASTAWGMIACPAVVGHHRRLMQNFFATCLALGILGGGFVLTGDLGRLTARGLRVIQATDVPAADALIPVTGDPAVAGTRSPAALAPVADPHPRPPHGLERVDVSMLAPGTRVTVWLATAAPAATSGVRPFTFDVVDPAARETLVSEVQPTAPGQAAVAPSPPRRVVVRGSGTGGEIMRGGVLEMETRGIAGAGGRETVGTVVALDLQR